MAMTPSAPSGKNARPNPVINVTPLVDVVLVVLIIFMIVTMMMTRTLSLNLPKEEKKDDT
ncbi:MAG TPA: biopolymer transporter ExbD, partial [Polyangiaceae bacterium]